MLNKSALVVLCMISALAGCAEWLPFARQPVAVTPKPQLTEELLMRDASAPGLTISAGRVITDNDAAFLSKVRMIEGARRSIDMAYYIFNDDYSSSYLAKALINAARRGVRVRLLVDYQTNYKRLDTYSMMEKLGGLGKGSLSVRFYDRPSKNVIQDAVYMTMGCGKELSLKNASAQCSKDKFAEIDKLFAGEVINGQSTAGRNISNLNVGNSGLFLSGLYSKRGDVMAMAIQQGEGIEPSKLGQGSGKVTPQDKQSLKKLANVYWKSRAGSAFQRLEAKGELYLAFAFYGQKVNPIYDTFTSVFPADKQFSEQEKRDWDHFTDFLHHKLILVDDARLQMGGRNVEDSYHMHPNPLTEKYVFMDTDVYVELEKGGDAVARAFQRLWNFDTMVATLDDVRQHAPNDVVTNLDAYRAAQTDCTKAGVIDEACTDKAFYDRAKDRAQRVSLRAQALENKARTYATQYLPKIAKSAWPIFELDRTVSLFFLENLPFDKDAAPLTRRYGVPVGHEAQNGKYIHDVWLKALPDVCLSASKENPKQVILHSAYFYPPANMTYALSRMVSGELDCSNVTVTVLTNSIDTTDLSVVNLLARHALKAFTEFYRQNAKPGRSAQFQYYEYQTAQPNLSLHSKVSVLGDDIIVGSANADVRSFVMDSNDAMFIHGAPDFAKRYIAFVQGILADPQRVKRLNDYFANTPRDAIVQEDLGTLHKLLAKYHADKHLNADERAQLEQRFVEMLNDSYTYTKNSIALGVSATSREQRQNDFNEWFKPI